MISSAAASGADRRSPFLEACLIVRKRAILLFACAISGWILALVPLFSQVAPALYESHAMLVTERDSYRIGIQKLAGTFDAGLDGPAPDPDKYIRIASSDAVIRRAIDRFERESGNNAARVSPVQMIRSGRLAFRGRRRDPRIEVIAKAETPEAAQKFLGIVIEESLEPYRALMAEEQANELAQAEKIERQARRDMKSMEEKAIATAKDRRELRLREERARRAAEVVALYRRSAELPRRAISLVGPASLPSGITPRWIPARVNNLLGVSWGLVAGMILVTALHIRDEARKAAAHHA